MFENCKLRKIVLVRLLGVNKNFLLYFMDVHLPNPKNWETINPFFANKKIIGLKRNKSIKILLFLHLFLVLSLVSVNNTRVKISSFILIFILTFCFLYNVSPILVNLLDQSTGYFTGATDHFYDIRRFEYLESPRIFLFNKKRISNFQNVHKIGERKIRTFSG